MQAILEALLIRLAKGNHLEKDSLESFFKEVADGLRVEGIEPNARTLLAQKAVEDIANHVVTQANE